MLRYFPFIHDISNISAPDTAFATVQKYLKLFCWVYYTELTYIPTQSASRELCVSNTPQQLTVSNIVFA